MREQGYLWLKGILDRSEVLAFRRRYFAAFAGAGLLAPGSDPVDGIYAGDGEDKAAVRRIMGEAVMWAAYEAFCLATAHHPASTKHFWAARPYLLKRKIIRYTKPGDAACTGAHYDLTYLRAGTDRLCTSWIPIGDTPVEMGGLVYLEGSDGWGRQLEAEFSIKNADLPPEERISAYQQEHERIRLAHQGSAKPGRTHARAVADGRLRCRRHGRAQPLHDPCVDGQRGRRQPHASLHRYSLSTRQ